MTALIRIESYCISKTFGQGIGEMVLANAQEMLDLVNIN